MVGGSTTSFERAEQTLKFMSKKVVHCGQLGTGLAAKIANK
jgi:3-hydroxyisobutyrate dehydrogenase